jgi:hypothetical protein
MMKSFTKTLLSLFSIITVCAVPFSLSSSAAAAERTLAGVKIFSPIAIVLKKYGDPTFLTTGDSVATVSYTYGLPTLTPPTGTEVPQATTSDSAAPIAPAPGDTAADFDTLYDGGSRYYYVFPKKGVAYEFVSTSAGRVVEIKVYGYHSAIRTTLGIGLGSTYEDIVLKYGYPESTVNDDSTSDGDILTLNYTDEQHIAFRLVRNKVAVISVVAPD